MRRAAVLRHLLHFLQLPAPPPHASLWCDAQCASWHSAPQYSTFRHREQSFSDTLPAAALQPPPADSAAADIAPQLAQQEGRACAAAAAGPAEEAAFPAPRAATSRLTLARFAALDGPDAVLPPAPPPAAAVAALPTDAAPPVIALFSSFRALSTASTASDAIGSTLAANAARAARSASGASPRSARLLSTPQLTALLLHLTIHKVRLPMFRTLYESAKARHAGSAAAATAMHPSLATAAASASEEPAAKPRQMVAGPKAFHQLPRPAEPPPPTTARLSTPAAAPTSLPSPLRRRSAESPVSGSSSGGRDVPAWDRWSGAQRRSGR